MLTKLHLSGCRSAVAALEFALISPIMILLSLAVFDIGRFYIAWQQLNYAAQAIASAAEKLSVTPGQTTTTLTPAQMQQALTSIYGQMPWLSLGTGLGLLPGAFSATLSDVVFCPTRTNSAYTSLGCGVGTGAQTGYTLWSTYLQYPSSGGPMIRALTRPCKTALVMESPTWNSNSVQPQPSRFQQIVDPSAAGTAGVVLTPQIVVDLQYQFSFTFNRVLPVNTKVTLWASAVLPTPYGDNTQAITYVPVQGSTLVVSDCTQL